MTKRSIWIVTRRAGYNLGSTLQAYAMRQGLAKLGYPGTILNYNDAKFRWRLRPAAETLLFTVMRLCPWLFRALWPREFDRLACRRIQRRKFDAFERELLVLTKERFRHSRDIARHVRDGDICICGSDQIWHPKLFDPTMFLDFAHGRHIRTIAYAPSLGLDRIESLREEIGNLIAAIDYVSVREESGVDQVAALTGRKVEMVVDPTLLLERTDWDAIKTPMRDDGPYILCYFLGGEQNPHAFISGLRATTGLRVKAIQMYNGKSRIAGELLKTVDPREFLGLVSAASVVCTDSFHCAVFSILFEREFFCFEKFRTTGPSSNHRLRSLLSQFGLEDRLLRPDATAASDPPRAPIDYGPVRPRLDEWRQTSASFLRNAIESESRTEARPN